MGMQRLLAMLTVLVGVTLAVTPWLLRFASDRVALLDVGAGGVIVALIGVASAYAAPAADRRHLSH